MFAYSCFNNDISEWNTSNVIIMTALFKTSNFNSDISKWNTSNVMDTSSMFQHTHFTGDISESEGHHPDILFGWGYAKIKITTHAIHGLSENDIILSAKIDKIND